MQYLIVIIPWAIAGIACWIGYQLIRQNGRILLRLESLGQQLEGLKLSVAAAPQAAQPPPSSFPLGSPAPPFELPEISGRTRKLSEWHGRRVLLIYFNPGCGFCVRMAPDIALLSKHSAGGIVPLLLSTGGVSENRKLIDEYGIECTVLLQKQMEVASTYNVSGTPSGYLLDAEGKIASAMAVGAAALLALADPPSSADFKAAGDHAGSNGSGHAPLKKAERDLSRSSLTRDGLPRGTAAPAFTLPRLDGGELSLESFRGRKVLLIFSDPGCGPCQQLAPQLNQLYGQSPGLQVLMVSRGDSDANRDKAREQNLTFPIVLQRQWEISRLYGMFATPIGYLIDEQGIIANEVAIGVEPILALFSLATTLPERLWFRSRSGRDRGSALAT